MSDLFRDKAADWDTRPVPAQISEGVFEALQARVPLTSELSVLDFGAGTGLLVAKLVPRVARVIAVDISAAMLERLAAKPELADRVEIVCRDLLRAPLDRRVDLIVSAMAMHHVEDTAALLATLRAHLEAGGGLALADLDREDGSFHAPGTEGVFHHGFDRDALAAALARAGFDAIEFGTACVVHRDERAYPVFLVTARAA
ncbi:MAG: methyltransferase domain-containing protein [Deltaproteobacteria bacterium]|nr:methyltransferase domain-containing protein [Deltaproteobacteria bacterium]MBK8240650.1 methyltransferase domain-containing protein [Deltaproteobacteria bacterium]MBK8718075.1 methyltransferase domain-containing protein [Deltaproteobacteria bacterium]MBP7288514.1 methyltransferase domain-containing protein [Nannocystaceae bacterium]